MVHTVFHRAFPFCVFNEMKTTIQKLIADSITVHEQLCAPEYVDLLAAIAVRMIAAYRAGKKVVLFGNGGSASDAQHFAAELVVRFEKNRASLPALALTANSSTLTAAGNDFGYEDVFSRQVEAFADEGDIVVGISTSGNSPNVLKAFIAAKAKKAVTIAFTGVNGGKLKAMADICFCAPSTVTGRIQECHILAVHILSKLVEDGLFE
jgi:D-sedoheptulose 7-phosphate isomerase